MQSQSCCTRGEARGQITLLPRCCHGTSGFAWGCLVGPRPCGGSISRADAQCNHDAASYPGCGHGGARDAVPDRPREARGSPTIAPGPGPRKRWQSEVRSPRRWCYDDRRPAGRIASPMHPTVWVSLLAYGAVVVAATRRSRVFGVFALIVLGLPTYVAAALRPELGAFGWVMSSLQWAACLHFAALLMMPGLRPGWFRVGVSIPGLYFVACSLLALPWAVAASFGLPPVGWWLPFVLALGGLVQSVWTREETVEVWLDPRRDVGALRRFPEGRALPDRDGRPLRIVQITDPHLGPFMSVERLRRICERAVERAPDLVLITGDLMTMESHDVDIVTAALQPLIGMRGRVFACHGNHDLEARSVVQQAYARLGITLLVDEAELISTPAGEVQVIGADFVWRHRDVHLRDLCERHPRLPGALRVILLHDPGGFAHLPDGQADLVLSGHTHGGQVGLLSLRSEQTFLSLFTKIPDHGLWAKGRNRLYVHRAQGHYGFPIRLGVPAEQSLMRVFR